jgi:hypothetical protein
MQLFRLELFRITPLPVEATVFTNKGRQGKNPRLFGGVPTTANLADALSRVYSALNVALTGFKIWVALEKVVSR